MNGHPGSSFFHVRSHKLVWVIHSSLLLPCSQRTREVWPRSFGMIGKFSLVSREALIISTMVVYIKFHMPSICQFRMLIEAASPDGSKGYLPFLKGRVSESRKSDITAFFPHGFASSHVDIFKDSFHMRLYFYGFLGEAVTTVDMEPDSSGISWILR